MTLTAPSPISAGIASLLDADIPFLLAVVMFFLVFAIGHATGYTHGHLNGVDRERQRLGSRLRHPAARRLRQDVTALAPQRFADAPIPRLTIPQLADWERRFSEAFRAQLPDTLAALDDQPRQVRFIRPDKRLVCGQPANTNLGTVRCLAAFGHPGRCS